jgi:hypothetical protein
MLHIMRLKNTTFLFCGVILASSASAAYSQQRQLDDSALMTTRQPYNVETYGVFRNMMLSGDFSAKVRMGTAVTKHPTTGVGAVADAHGEITIYDGKLIVSYGKPGTHPDANWEYAALLAMGTADDWQSVTVDHDIAPSEVEASLAATAKAHGVDPNVSFPFEMRGTLLSYVMHVNATPTDGPHGMGLPMAITIESKGDQIDGGVAGLYVSDDLMGIATHGGEHTHAHWVSADGASTAHLDHWGLKSGTVLLLPKP